MLPRGSEKENNISRFRALADAYYWRIPHDFLRGLSIFLRFYLIFQRFAVCRIFSRYYRFL